MLSSARPKMTALDAVLACLLVLTGLYLLYRIKAGIHYEWNWGAIPQYILRFDPDQQKWLPNLLLQGLFTTLRLSVWGTLLATLVGLVMGLFRISSSPFRRMLGGTYVELIRNTPPLVLIFIFYFFISDQILPLLRLDMLLAAGGDALRSLCTVLFAPPHLLSTFLSALMTLSIFEGAYITEIIRGGIQSIERGQWEAADALGFSGRQRMRHVILPQAVRRILPPLAGQFISTIKDSAIVSVISIQDLTFQGMELMSATYLTFEIWITITGLYLLLTLTLSLAVARIEARLHRSHG